MIYKLIPILVDRIRKTSGLFDSKNNEKFNWELIKGSKYNMMTRDDAEGKMMVKAEAVVDIDVMNLISILYEDEYYIDWVINVSKAKLRIRIAKNVLLYQNLSGQ